MTKIPRVLPNARLGVAKAAHFWEEKQPSVGRGLSANTKF